jgi:aminobenzoyl-glutamate utilization protein B
MTSNSETIWRHVDDHAETFKQLADAVWETPEVNYTEFRSAATHQAELERQGFRITTGLAGIPTSMMGEAGEGGPVIAILGEYDALSGLSQEAGVAEPAPRPGESAGHGCGHNLLGSAAMLAATAVRDWLKERGIQGRVRYYGCPAEEGGAAKAFMARDGVFSDVDVAISWHPGHFAGVMRAESLAMTVLDVTWTGRASHAAASPHLGRSALDAAELMNVGLNYMREHVPSSARMHYAYLDAGGIAPNVVQAKTTVRYIIRAADLATMRGMVARVRAIAEGAALMTETTAAMHVSSGMSNLLGNEVLERVMHANLERLGPPGFDAADVAFAKRFRDTLSREDIESAYEPHGIKPTDAVLADTILPFGARGEGGLGSTDVGDVSWVVPTVQAWGATCAIGTPFHSWQFTGQGKAAAAHKGMIHAAKAMAGTAVELLSDATLIGRARDAFRERLGGQSYDCPIPAETKPPVAPPG